MSDFDPDPPVKLFIGDNNRIRQQIEAPPDSIAPGPVLDAIVTFTIRKANSYTADFVGVENIPLPHVAGDTQGWYEETWSESQSIFLKLNRSYWLHIKAPGYTQRLIECIALYRDDE